MVNFLSLMFLFIVAGPALDRFLPKTSDRDGTSTPEQQSQVVMVHLPSSAWNWFGFLCFLFVLRFNCRALLHSVVWIVLAPAIFVLVMIFFVVLLK